MNTTTNTHSQNLHSQNSNPQNSSENNSYTNHYLKPSSPCHPIMEKLILKSIISFEDYIESQGTTLTIEDFQANSTTLYKLSCSYTQIKSLEIKHRQLLMKEEAHRLKHYVPAESPPPPPPQSNYPTSETYVPGPTNIHYPGPWPHTSPVYNPPAPSTFFLPPDPEPEPEPEPEPDPQDLFVTTYESLTPAQRTFVPSMKPSNPQTPPPPPPTPVEQHPPEYYLHLDPFEGLPKRRQFPHF